MDTERLLSSLFSDRQERALAGAIVHNCTRGWREDRVTALLHELASTVPEGMSNEQSAAYLVDFVRNLGAFEHEVGTLARWIGDGGPGWEPEPVPGEAEPAPAPEEAAGEGTAVVDPGAVLTRPVAPPVPAGPTREQLQVQIRQHEANMRAPQGSELWNAYWRHGGDQDYRAALLAMDNAQPSPVEPAT
jgi:hypothetical protein